MNLEPSHDTTVIDAAIDPVATEDVITRPSSQSSRTNATMTILYSPLVWAAVAFFVAVVFLQFERICKLLAPSGLKGIAVFPNSSPITGDVPRLAHWIKDKHQVSSFFDDAAAQLGDVCHIRTGPRMGG